MSAAGDDSQPNDRTRQLASRSRVLSRLPPVEKRDPDSIRRSPADAEIMFVGEQPGDKEDLQGRPFIGPAGLLLDRALAEAGVDRGRVYVTNAVKHFKFEPRGKRRLHKRPNASEIKICRRWLSEEIELIHPRLIVALGATAAQGLAERAIPVHSNRGKVLDVANGLRVFITIHPSALLRLQDDEERHSAYAAFVNDLRAIEQLAKAPASQSISAVRAAG